MSVILLCLQCFEAEPKRGTRFALSEFYPPAVRLHQGTDDAKAKACAAVFAFGREKRIIDLGLIAVRNP